MIHFLLSTLLCLPLTAGETHPSFTADVPVKVEATVPASSINDIKRTVAAANQYAPLEIMDEIICQRLEYNDASKSVFFHIYIDEEVDDDWGFDEVDGIDEFEFGKFLIALMAYVADNGEEADVTPKELSFCTKVQTLVNQLKDERLGAVVKLRSVDGCTYNIRLTPLMVKQIAEEYKDIVIGFLVLLNDEEEMW